MRQLTKILKSNARSQTLIVPRSGFTLMEFLIYFTIIAVLGTGIAGSLVSMVRGGALADARSEVESNLRVASEKIKNDINNATAVSLPSGVSSSTLSLTTDEGSVIYTFSNNRLLRQVEGGDNLDLMSDKVTVDTATFERYENTNPITFRMNMGVLVNLTVSYDTSNPALEYTAGKYISVNAPGLIVSNVRKPPGDSGTAGTDEDPEKVVQTVPGDNFTAPAINRDLPAPASNEYYEVTKVAADIGIDGTVIEAFSNNSTDAWIQVHLVVGVGGNYTSTKSRRVYGVVDSGSHPVAQCGLLEVTYRVSWQAEAPLPVTGQQGKGLNIGFFLGTARSEDSEVINQCLDDTEVDYILHSGVNE